MYLIYELHENIQHILNIYYLILIADNAVTGGNNGYFDNLTWINSKTNTTKSRILLDFAAIRFKIMQAYSNIGY